MSSLPPVTKDYLHTPQGDLSTHITITDHAHNPFNTHHDITTMTSPSHTAQPDTTDQSDTPTECPTPNPPHTHGYTSLPLPELRQQEI